MKLTVLDVARLAIASIGSYDRSLQSHYEKQLQQVLDDEADGWPPIGSVWKENDKRSLQLPRKVLAHDRAKGKVQLDGYPTTWAKVERFNGKSSGYSRVDSPDAAGGESK